MYVRERDYNDYIKTMSWRDRSKVRVLLKVTLAGESVQLLGI